MYKCIYSGEEFDKADKEHILQNFLGARWSDNTIVCNRVQKDFGHTIDPGFEIGLKPLRTILGVKGGRGGEPPPIKGLKTKSGGEYNIEAGGHVEIASPISTVTSLEDGRAEIRIETANEKQFDWAIHQLRTRFPKAEINTEEFRKTAVRSQFYLKEPIRLRLALGGPDFFRGLCKSAFNLLGVTKPLIIQQQGLDAIRNFILKGVGDSKDFIGWVLSDTILHVPRLGESDHFVGVYARGGEICGIIQLYGDLPFMIRLGTSFSCDDFAVSYVVNPFRDSDPSESRNLSLQPENLQDYSSCAHIPSEEVWPYYISRIERILGVFYKRADQRMASQIVNDVLGKKEGQIITAEDCNEMNRRVEEYLAHRLTNQSKPDQGK